MTERTKQCKNLHIIFTIIHFICMFGPLLYFIPYAYSIGGTGRKVGLSLFIVVALCLSVFAIIADAKTRGGLAKTILWTIIMGVCLCLTEVKTFIYVMAIVSILDELVFTKLSVKYKDAYAANKEIDRRQ